MKSFKTSVFFSGIAILLTGWLLIYQNPTVLAQEISRECPGTNTKQRADCIEQLVIKEVAKDPSSFKQIVDGFWTLLQTKKIVDDPRLFLSIIHDVAPIAGQKLSLNEAVTACPLSFRGACIHGVLMNYIDDTYPSVDLTAFLNLCEPFTGLLYANCVHGVGHELAAKIQGSLPGMLAPCASVAPAFQNDCTSGVFMEYSKGEAGQGYHSNDPVGRKEFDCSAVQQIFKETCYTSAGFYRQYEITSEPWATTYAFCAGTPARYKEDCLRGVDAELLFSTVGDKHKSAQVCKTLPADVAKPCLNLLDSTPW